MKRLAVLAVIVVVGGFAYMVRDVGHIPLFSPNLERLAETDTEGYCAGVAFWSASSTSVKAREAATCRSERGDTPYNLSVVQTAFCQGITFKGYEPGIGACKQILSNNKGWPTYDWGLFTGIWTRKFPYPGDTLLQPSESRTGDREGNLRDES